MKRLPPLLIIKLGGSVITDKATGHQELNKPILFQIAKEIKRAQQKKSFRLAIVCGVGSFGHGIVNEYHLDQKIKTARQKKGIHLTLEATKKLGKSVSKILSNNDLKPVFISCEKTVRQKDKKIQSFDETSFADALNRGFIPLTTGTMVVDDVLGYSVLSGDEIVGQLAIRLQAKKVLLGTDVDGIYTADPRINPKAKLIRRVTVANLKSVIAGAGQSQSVDVTKGMKGKIEKIAAHLHGKPAVIFNLTKSLYLQQLLVGKTTPCTRIHLKKE